MEIFQVAMEYEDRNSEDYAIEDEVFAAENAVVAEEYARRWIAEVFRCRADAGRSWRWYLSTYRPRPVNATTVPFTVPPAYGAVNPDTFIIVEVNR
jgi:hypothetical protein